MSDSEKKPIPVNRRIHQWALEKPEHKLPKHLNQLRIEEIDFSAPDLVITPQVKRIANDSWFKDGVFDEAIQYMHTRNSDLRMNGWTRKVAKERAWWETIQEFPIKLENVKDWKYTRQQTETRNRVARVIDLVAESVTITGLHPAMNWALANLMKVGDPKDDRTWLVSPQEAPSAEHWNYLMLAAQSPKQFMEVISAELKLIQSEQRKFEIEEQRKQKQHEREMERQKKQADARARQQRQKLKLQMELEQKKVDEALRLKIELAKLKEAERQIAEEAIEKQSKDEAPKESAVDSEKKKVDYKDILGIKNDRQS